MTSNRATALAAVIVLAVAPAAAFHDTCNVVAESTLNGPGWVARHMIQTSTTADITPMWHARVSDVRRLVLATFIVEDNGSTFSIIDDLSGGSTIVVRLQTSQETIVDERIDPLDVADTGDVAAGQGTVFFHGAGSFWVVQIVVASGDVTEATLALCGTNLVTDATTSGSDVFIDMSEEFAGTNVAVNASVARAQVASEAVVIEPIDHLLFGGFTVPTLRAGSASISFDGPGGGGSGSSRYFFSGSPPGSYRFRVDAASYAAPADIMAFGADVSLPR